jgi:hypothetical protein
MPNREILIITACVEPQRVFYLTISDPNERLRQLICALVSWILYTKIPTIVLCDNGLREYDFTGIADFARDHDKAFEALHVKPDPLTEELGKGHGEGSTIRHVLSHSKYIEENTSFYKVTGNSFVANFDEISAREAANSLVFGVKATPLFSFTNLKYIGTKSFSNARHHYCRRGILCFLLKPVFLPTHFYKCNVSLYKKFLLDKFNKVLDSKGYYLEHAFYDSLRFRAHWDTFSIKPRIVGRSGSSGTLHDGDYSEGIKKIAEGFIERMK